MVAAVIASEVSVRSRIAAAEQATLPAATAVLSGDSPASTPPLTPSAASAAVLSLSRRKENIQASQLAAHTPSVTASTMLLAPAPRRGSASGDGDQHADQDDEPGEYHRRWRVLRVRRRQAIGE